MSQRPPVIPKVSSAKPVQRAGGGGAAAARRDIERGDFFHQLSRFPKSEATLIETLNRIDQTSVFLKAELLKYQVEEEERHYLGSIEGLVKSDIDLMKGFAKSAYLDAKLGAKLREIHACIGQLYELEKTLTTQLSQGYEAVVASAHGNLSDIHVKFYTGPAIKTVVQSEAAEVQTALRATLALEEQAKHKGADSFEAMLELIAKAEEMAESTKQMSRVNEVQLGKLLPKLREIEYAERSLFIRLEHAKRSKFSENSDFFYAINFGMHKQMGMEPSLKQLSQNNTLLPIDSKILTLFNGDILSIHTVYKQYHWNILQENGSEVVSGNCRFVKGDLVLGLKNTNLVVSQGPQIAVFRTLPSGKVKEIGRFEKKSAKYLDPCLELRNGDVLVKVFDTQLNCSYVILNITSGFREEIPQNFSDTLQKVKRSEEFKFGNSYSRGVCIPRKDEGVYINGSYKVSLRSLNIWDGKTGVHKANLGLIKYRENFFNESDIGWLQHSSGVLIFTTLNSDGDKVLEVRHPNTYDCIRSFSLPDYTGEASYPKFELENGQVIVRTKHQDKVYLLDLNTGITLIEGARRVFSNGKALSKSPSFYTVWDINKESAKINFKLEGEENIVDGVELIDGGRFLVSILTKDKKYVIQIRNTTGGELIKSIPVTINLRSMHYLGNNELIVEIKDEDNGIQAVRHEIYDSRTFTRKRVINLLEEIEKAKIQLLRASIGEEMAQLSHLSINTWTVKEIERCREQIHESGSHFANMKQLLSSVKEALRSRAASLQSSRQAVQRFSSSIDATEDINDKDDLQAVVEAVIDDSLFFQYQLLNQSHNKYIQDVCIENHSGDQEFEAELSKAANPEKKSAVVLKTGSLSSALSMIQNASMQSYCTQVLQSAVQGKAVVPMREYSEGLIKELMGRLTISKATKKSTTTNLAKTGGGASKEGGGAAAPAKPGKKK